MEIPSWKNLDISQFSYLSFLVANVEPGEENPVDSEIQTSINVALTLEIKEPDETMIKRSRSVDTKAFGRIPHPYQRSWLGCETCTDNQQAILIGIRIPLSEFGLSQEELNQLQAIEMEMDASGNPKGNIALDDIFFTQ